MKKVIDITEELKKKEDMAKEKSDNPVQDSKATNPIIKKLAQFTNDKLSKKFDINDLLR